MLHYGVYSMKLVLFSFLSLFKKKKIDLKERQRCQLVVPLIYDFIG